MLPRKGLDKDPPTKPSQRRSLSESEGLCHFRESGSPNLVPDARWCCWVKDEQKRAEGELIRLVRNGKAGNGIQRYDVHIKNLRMVSYKPESLNRNGVAIIWAILGGKTLTTESDLPHSGLLNLRLQNEGKPTLRIAPQKQKRQNSGRVARTLDHYAAKIGP